MEGLGLEAGISVRVIGLVLMLASGIGMVRVDLGFLSLRNARHVVP